MKPSFLTRAGAWLLNAATDLLPDPLAAILCRWAPVDVVIEAIACTRFEEARAVARARAALMLREMEQELADLEQRGA